MTNRIKFPVSVTERHIKESERADGAYCMVARAFYEQYDLTGDPEATISVDGRTIDLFGSEDFSAPLPGHVQRKIEKWDDDIDPEPFTFDVYLPADWRERLNKEF